MDETDKVVICKYFTECPAIIAYWDEACKKCTRGIAVPKECITSYESCPLYKLFEEEDEDYFCDDYRVTKF